MMDMINKMHKQRLVIIIAAAIGVISAFLPWASIDGGFLGRVSVNGIQGDGLITFLAFIAAGVLAFLGDQKQPITTDAKFKWGIVGTGALAALIAVIAMINVSGVPFTSVGFGVYLSILAGAVIVAIPFLDPKMLDSLPIGADSSADDNPAE